MPADGSTARPRRSQAERRDESERRLMTATIAVICDQGVRAATFEAIGTRAGYSRGLAAQKYGSKQGMIEALIAHLHARQNEALAAAGVDTAPGLEAVLGYVEHFIARLREDDEGRAYFMLLADAVADLSALRTAFAASHEKVERMLEAMILRGQAEGAIRPEVDADAAALSIGSLLMGLSIQSLIDPAMDLAPIRATSLAMLRGGLAVVPASGA
ncbi:TetR family transcriptional regulator [Caulobacter mirabilis]|uniref:TetR family transcriptional regulator n=2 Tax=Caulobacter mirabilis TaxID=69666 RepID=A0A2D2B4F9_9CAUL|nr:TetR family transcriptional regulator [Caulobacter mirabilis]